jgi:hypothetical protein
MPKFDVGTAEKPATLHIINGFDQHDVGDDGEDIFVSLTTENFMEGKGGIDRAILSGNRADYELSIGYGKFQTLWVSTNGDDYHEVEQFEFADGVLRADIEGNAGMAYWLYKAAFDRKPDTPGLKHQIEALDNGMDYLTMSKNFVESAEFKQLYGGNPNDVEFVTALYANVLQRNPDEQGLADHLTGIQQGMSREQLLFNFATSYENRDLVREEIQDGIWLG